MSQQRNSSAGGPLMALKQKMDSLRNDLEDSKDRCDCLQQELTAERETRMKTEDEIKGYTRKIQLLEDDLERTQTKLDEATGKLEEATKSADESERARRTLDCRSKTDEDRVEYLEGQVKQLVILKDDVERNYEEAARKLTVTQDQLDRAEEKNDDYSKRLRELECEVTALGQRARSYESDVSKASQREDSYEETIRDLTQRLKDYERRFEETDRERTKLQNDFDKLESKYTMLEDDKKKLQDDMDLMMNDIDGL